MKLAFLFPGQGAQAVGMGRALADAFPEARETFATADRVLGFALSELCWNGPAEELKKSVHTQPALLTHSVAAWRLLEASGVTPDYCAGHSLGEYSACVAAGALSFEDALTLTRRRGELMYEAGLARPGAMAALLGLSAADAEAACADAAGAGIVRAANLNAPGQVVISGEPAAVELACEKAKARGAKRAIKLEVSGAFHSPLMASAAEGLQSALANVTLRDARCPVVSNAWARPMQKADDIRRALGEQVLASVRWEESMRLLRSEGVEGFVELGTGKVLRGLLRTIDSAATSWNVEDPDSLAATRAALAGAGRTA
ncbi:MAG: ACP S-malonyltransferase [Candidatus Eisenbacteria bacterium]